ncbi:hypothetical protein SLE2022_028880 [Rubroshorea leprosula]
MLMGIQVHFACVVVVVVISLVFGSLNSNSLPCDDARCRTESCNSSGDCICDLPDPSTVLDGNRTFLGGEFCDEEMTMCDGTNSFWCEHGGICEEIVQGENYTCNCRPGFTGQHCENSGAPCGPIFCFHEAECLVEGHLCECPPQWKGSVDCSVPTKPKIDSSSSSSTVKRLDPAGNSTNHSNNWVVVLVVLFSVGAVAGVVFYVNNLYNKRKEGAQKFQPLSHMQTEEYDEGNSLVSG